MDSAEFLLYDLLSISKSNLEDYLKAYPQWLEMVHKSIEESKVRNSSCIVIDKYARNCHLYKNGNLTNTFTIELGQNWMGDKQHQGDKSTPEGIYSVAKRKPSQETKYYKALLLNYPNEDDKKRFLDNKKNGTIKKDMAIGGLIEIHGHGGKGIDWTDGCIALTDADMDKLYEKCPEGTIVTIVGSLRSFEDILQYQPQ